MLDVAFCLCVTYFFSVTDLVTYSGSGSGDSGKLLVGGVEGGTILHQFSSAVLNKIGEVYIPK